MSVSLILFQATLDALLFPFRLFFFLFSKNSYRKEIERILTSPAPGFTTLNPDSSPKGPPAPKKIFISVGDISAEPHAIRLMREIQKREPKTQWLGFGGKRMEKEGCKILFNPIELALIGFAGPAKKIPAHIRALKAFVQAIETEKPDLVILLDYPGFNLYLARAAKDKVPVVYYICPQLWAWAPWRIRAFQKYVQQALSILPFETKYFREKGIHTDFIGHPIADHLAESDQSRKPTPPTEEKVLAILPGSRNGEVLRNLPAMLRVTRKMFETVPNIQVVLPHDREDLIPLLRKLLENSPIPVTLAPGKLHETLSTAHLVFVKSGTAVLEVAHYRAPMIVFYKFGGGFKGLLSEWMRHNFLIPPYFTSLNLLAGREIVPEFAYAGTDKEEEIAQKAVELWKTGPTRDLCIQSIRETQELFDRPGTAARAAELVLARWNR